MYMHSDDDSDFTAEGSSHPGGHYSPERAIRVCPVVKTPHFRLSGTGSSSDPQFHFVPVLKTPDF